MANINNCICCICKRLQDVETKVTAIRATTLETNNIVEGYEDDFDEIKESLTCACEDCSCSEEDDDKE